MYSTDVITPQHLARTAVIYIRQSTPHQAIRKAFGSSMP
jgi:hypothetical protein